MEDFPSVLGGISADQFLSEYWQKKTSFNTKCFAKFRISAI